MVRRASLVAIAASFVACNLLVANDEPALEPTDAGFDAPPPPPPPPPPPAAPADAPPCQGIALDSDRENCGACGHSCLGAECSAGVCQPQLFIGNRSTFVNISEVYGLVVLGDTLYGTNWYVTGSGVVWRVPAKTGGDPQFIVPDGLADLSVSWLATDGTDLFYKVFRYSGAGIWRVHTDGTGNTHVVPRPENQFDDGIEPVAVDASYFYWGMKFSSGLFRANKDGTNVIATRPASGISWLVPDHGEIFFAQRNDRGVYRASPDALDSAELVAPPGTNAVTSLQVDATHVYYSDDSSRVFRAPRSGGSAEDITPTDLCPGPILVDDTHVYCFGKYSISRFDKKTGAYRFIASVPAPIDSPFVVDGGDVIFFSVYGDQSGPPYAGVYRLVK
jgi:hypothetical protein